MGKAISDNGLKVLNYIIENEDKDLTAQAIADALGFEKKATVDGVVTSGLIGREPNAKNLVERVSGGAVKTENGIKEIKYIKVTAAGKAYDHEAAIAADIAAKTAPKAE